MQSLFGNDSKYKYSPGYRGSTLDGCVFIGNLFLRLADSPGFLAATLPSEGVLLDFEEAAVMALGGWEGALGLD
jgi:hypothetical protein